MSHTWHEELCMLIQTSQQHIGMYAVAIHTLHLEKLRFKELR